MFDSEEASEVQTLEVFVHTPFRHAHCQTIPLVVSFASMPRFQLSTDDDDIPALGGFSSPPSWSSPSGPTSLARQTTGMPRSARNASKSVGLMTLSPDGRSLHVLTGLNSIETRRLPISEEEQEQRHDTEEKDLPAVIRTILPEHIQSALQIDAPVELICVEGESRGRKNESNELENLPRLCLYTRKSAFLLTMAYRRSSSAGVVVTFTEPFDRLLEDSYSTSILRIRPAPQQHGGYATLCPPTSMAALLHDSELNEYNLSLHHHETTSYGSESKTTEPLIFRMEELADEDQEEIVDFCFAQSKGLPAFTSLAVLLLKGSGDILAASPIVFEGTILPKSEIEEGLGYLRSKLASEDRSTAVWRQCRAAQQYMMDVFPVDPRSHFVTARLLEQRQQSAATWPVQLQGPVLVEPDRSTTTAVTIENFGGSSVAVGVVVARGGRVDFAALAPTSLLPRFAFEDANDSYTLDGELANIGAVVEKVLLNEDESSQLGQSTNNLRLVRDEVAETLLHYVTPTSVVTISTRALAVLSRRLQGSDESSRTTAWAALNASFHQASIVGVAVPKDFHSGGGHELIARLSDGSFVPVNVTEAQHVHEMANLFEGSLQHRDRLLANAPSDGGVASTPPFYDTIEPLVEKVKNGVAGMSKIGGSETSYKDLSPEMISVALKIKMQCDKEVVLPLLELKKMVDARRDHLEKVAQVQREEVARLRQAVARAQKQFQIMQEDVKTAESNASELTKRSSAALQASHDLLPTITQAEFDYFNDIKRLAVRCHSMQRELNHLKPTVGPRCVSLKNAGDFEVSQVNEGRMNDLLNDSGGRIQDIRGRFKNVEMTTMSIAKMVGLNV